MMGDAYTAIADDAYSLFYNPALLARHKGFSFTPLNIGLGVTNALADMDRFENIPDDTAGLTDAFMDYPVYLGVGWNPGFKMGNFALSSIYSDITSVRIMNKITPTMDIDYRSDSGFIFGYAQPLVGTFDPESGGSQFSLGLGIKYIERKGIFGAYPLTSTSILDAAGSGDLDTILDNLGLAEGSGWGWDVGVDYINKTGPSTFTAGLVAKDVTTTIETKSNTTGSDVVQQTNHWNMGFGFKQELGPMHYQVSLDFRNLENQSLALQSRTRMGFEVGLPVLTVLAGYSQGYYSWGVKTNLFFMDIFLGFYDVELGERLNQQKGSRAVIAFNLLDFTFQP